MDAPRKSLAACSVRCIAGAEAIWKVLPMLELAAEEWGQKAAVQELPFFLSIPRRTPVLLLVTADQAPSSALRGAVFLYAYGHPVFGKRLLSNADRFGRIGVFGPVTERLQIATAAMSFMLRNGSALIRLTLVLESNILPEQTAQEHAEVLRQLQARRPAEEWAFTSHDLFFNLTLHPNLDDTLAQLGRRTRRNVRDVMRKCVAELDCTFIAHAEATLETFLAMNRRATRPVSSQIARWRYTQCHAPFAFLSGVQAADGRWLCLAGGRISADTVIVEWQMNDLSFARFSPSLLMRGFLMQHFGQRDMRFLVFGGGTAHRMAGSFNKRTVHSLEARRPVVWLTLTQKSMQRFLPTRAMTRVLFGFG